MSEPPAPDRPVLVDPVTLSRLERPELAAALAPLFEDAGPLVEALLGRTFATWDEVLDAAAAVVAGMDDDTLARLLAAHPRIGASPEALARRSALSWAEQGGAAVTPAAVTARLGALNDDYERRFGFPFVEWVAGRHQAALIPVLEARLARDRASELAAGAAALVAIARDRLAHLRSGTR